MHIRFHSTCGTDLGRSIAVVTDNIHAIDVVKPAYRSPTFQLTAKAVWTKYRRRIKWAFGSGVSYFFYLLISSYFGMT